MIFRTPSYCDLFRCSADKCSDNCCIGWEIDIDEATARLYSRVEGPLGEKLKSSIARTDESYSFILKEERCPFLNEKNLCEIIIASGEKHLCQICRDHPRFFEWYGEIKEGGIGLCCEEGARLILTAESPCRFSENQIPYEAGDECDPELLRQLSFAREQIFSALLRDDKSFTEKAVALADYGERVQALIDNFSKEIPEISFEEGTAAYRKKALDMLPIIKSFSFLEAIDEKWENCLRELEDNFEHLTSESILSEKYKVNLAVYFIYRHFLKGAFDGEILSKIKLALVSVAFIDLMVKNEKFKSGTADFEKIVRCCVMYSKQMEYSQENLDAFSDMTYELECLR